MLSLVALDELDRIRQKVVAGDRLTDAELAALERAAARERTPSLRLAVAHALMNAEEDRRALELVRPLKAERPRDVNVKLAMARALLGLDRYSDAETELKEVLALRPGDPEALKALAALSMRHGELSRAKALVADAVRRDPFDGEARILKEELESAAGEPASLRERPEVAPLPEFVAALLAGLRSRQVRHLVRGKDLLLRLPGEAVARVDFASLHAEYAARAVPLEAGVRAAIDGLTALRSGLPDTREDLLARVLPVLRPSGFVERATGAVHREGPASLLIYYVLEDPELVRYLPPSALQTLGLSLEEVDAAAFANLARAPVDPIRVAPDPAGGIVPTTELPSWCALASGDGHDGARLLTEPQRVKLEETLGAGPWRVHLGRRELVVVTRASEDRQPLAALPASADGITGTFLLTREGQLSSG